MTNSQPLKLSERVILITGAAAGIGAASAQALALQGANIVVTDIDNEAASTLAESLPGKSLALKLDVCDEAAWSNVINEVVKHYGRLDVLINNAGGAGSGTVESISVDDYRRVMKLNIDSVFIGCKLAVEVMKEHGGGNIINVSSIHGRRAASYAAPYSAAKGAVRLLTKSVALHCAEQAYNIRCNSIHPGYILTPQMQDWLDKSEDPEAAMADLVAKHPIGFLGAPEDVANAIVFLASDDSRFMTGTELVIDGGYELV